MIIKGLQKLTLLDFPGVMAATVFFGGCNFRCPFCHNASLVIGERMDDYSISEEELFSFLEKRRGMLGGVCISGGEPTLVPQLEEFIRKIKAMGYKVKLDTNGYRPEVLKSLVDNGLLDYVAMDIKNSREKYSLTAGVDIDTKKIEKSAEILMNGKVPFEFRTTVVKELHNEADMANIGKWLSGEEKFFLQGFIDSGDLISEGLNGFNKNDLNNLLNVLKVYIPNAQIRG